MPFFRSARYLALLALVLLTVVFSSSPACAQTPAGDSKPQTASPVEEAYNQEAGVVQHISAFTRLWDSKDWACTFTQEWPAPGRPRHQLSYTVAFSSIGAYPGAGPGFADALFNYRYQLLGNGESRVAFAPRASLVTPTGSARFGHDSGGFGFQANLPLSVVLSKRLVTHWNLGTTLIPNARNAAGERASTAGYNAGQSVLWLAKPRFNVLVETLWLGTEAVVGRGQTRRSHSLLVSPGIRWAHNFKSGLQIVPGVAVPMGVGPSRGERGVIVYLSVEHPWRKLYGTQ